MCGISGILNIKDSINDVRLIEKMTDLIQYRGPDDSGYLAADFGNNSVRSFQNCRDILPGKYNLLLGHRRLSIIDTSKAGHQPMSYNDDAYWIVFNGEIYNYLELRKRLSQKGYQFKTNSDTEVLLASYEEWGVKSLDKFNGMFAFALYDSKNNILFCARDRLGIKPFYYNFSKGYFSFASEIKQLLKLPWISKQYNPGVIFDFFVFSSYGANSEQTAFKDLYELRGGHYIIISLDCNCPPDPVKWWDIDIDTQHEKCNEKYYAQKYYSIFEDAIKLRLRSDVPVGTCLSGGLDSSGIVCVVDKLMRESNLSSLQKTFTAVSDYKEFDEKNYAQIVINDTSVDPYFTLPTPEILLKDMEDLIWHQDEPFVSTSIFAGWCVYRLVKNSGVTVSLDGQGPDEVLGGYVPSMYPGFLAGALLSLNFHDFFNNAYGLHNNYSINYLQMMLKTLKKLLQGKLPSSLMPSIAFAKDLFKKDFFYEGLKNSLFYKQLRKNKIQGSSILYDSVKTKTLPGILRQVDRSSMAFSVEARLPFLDHRLVEYSFSLPFKQKFKNGISKYIYRKAMQNKMPDKIVNRYPKLGFVTAEPKWIKNNQKLQNQFKEVFDNIQEDNTIFNRSKVLKIYNSYINHNTPYTQNIWKIFNTVVWENLFFKE